MYRGVSLTCISDVILVSAYEFQENKRIAIDTVAKLVKMNWGWVHEAFLS